MGNEPFTHMFPEWMLSEALAKCLSKSKRDLWTWQVVDPADGHNTVVSLADVFSRPTPPQIEPEWVFAKDDYARYGIDQVRWETTFWGSRPDFAAHSQDDGLLVLLEAKGGEVPPRTWKDPKELVYWSLLKECRTFKKKGLYYIVPRKSEIQCRKCLCDYFSPGENLQSGMLLWENLLPLISHELLGTAIDQVIRELEGLRNLREYQIKMSG